MCALTCSWPGSEAARERHVKSVALAGQRLTLTLGWLGSSLTEAAAQHDVGYQPALAATGLHALDGARFLSSRGADPVVVSLVAYHTGAEFEAEERGLYGQLAQFQRPVESLLDALNLCDLTVGPEGQPMTVDQRIAEILTRYAHEHPVHRAVQRSRGYLRESAWRAAVATGSPEHWGFPAA